MLFTFQSQARGSIFNPWSQCLHEREAFIHGDRQYWNSFTFTGSCDGRWGCGASESPSEVRTQNMKIRPIWSGVLYKNYHDIFEMKRSWKLCFKPELVRDEFCSFLRLQTGSWLHVVVVSSQLHNCELSSAIHRGIQNYVLATLNGHEEPRPFAFSLN